MHVGRIGSDYRHCLHLLRIERQEVAVIFQQHDCFFRRLQRKSLVCGAVDRLRSIVSINIWILEQTEPEFCRQNSAYRSIQFCLGNDPLFDLIGQRRVNRSVGKIVVHASSKRLARSLGFISSDVMRFDQHLQAITVGSHVSLKAPLLAQYAVEQPLIDV